MAKGYNFDESAARRVEAVYLTPDVVATRSEILRSLELRPGERVLDIGSGPGLLAFDMAATVGDSGRVCGIDLSEPMLEMSRRRCAELGWTEFHNADATKLPFEDASFDAATSIQVYEYVADMPAALSELYRVLRPGGRALIMDTDYDSLVIHTEDQARLDRVLAAWDDHFVHRDLPRRLAPMLRDIGLTVRQSSALPLFNPEYHANSFSHGVTALMAAFAVDHGHMTKEDAKAWTDELAALGAKGAYFYSINRYMFLAEKPDAN